ncbi:MAG: tRNA dihydrouridine(20/20a) synthase DusA, partial [Gammaproteobacteria bacterium]
MLNTSENRPSITTRTHRVCVAPMMDYTDRHFRYFIRLMSRHTRLYTEMLTTGAVLHGDRRRFLEFHQAEHPLALQLGGSEPRALAECTRIAGDYGYDEVNLNVGCPSDRVQAGRFGACLMTEPQLVAECVSAMTAASTVPVTVKTRIGVDEHDSYEHLTHFVGTVAAAGCRVFVIHARKAWLKGLSPKENREIPPLRYDVAERLKRDFPALGIIVNGGIKTLAVMENHLAEFDGVMIGR